VRNLPDGRVRVVAEGAETEVQEFIREIQSQMMQYIKETTTTPLAGPPEFRDFHIG
jgi:acylphosphatase